MKKPILIGLAIAIGLIILPAPPPANGQLTDLGAVMSWPPRQPSSQSAAPSYGTAITLDGASEYMACVVSLPASGTIHGFVLSSGTVTSGCTTCVAGITTVDSVGTATSTAYGGSTNNTAAVVSGNNTGQFFTLTADATAVAGDVVAMYLSNPSSSPANFQIRTFADETSGTKDIPYTGSNTTGSFVKTLEGCVGAIQYTVGGNPKYYIIPGVVPAIQNLNQESYNSGNNPNHRGLRFQMPVPARNVGFGIWWDNGATGQSATFKFVGSDGNAASPTTSITVDTDQQAAAQIAPAWYHWPTAVTISANTTYRVVMLPDANNKIFYKINVNTGNEAVLGAFAGTNWYSTTGNNPTTTGDWLDTTTTSPWIWLLFDQMSAGSQQLRKMQMMLGVGGDDESYYEKFPYMNPRFVMGPQGKPNLYSESSSHVEIMK